MLNLKVWQYWANNECQEESGKDIIIEDIFGDKYELILLSPKSYEKLEPDLRYLGTMDIS